MSRLKLLLLEIELDRLPEDVWELMVRAMMYDVYRIKSRRLIELLEKHGIDYEQYYLDAK